MTYRADTPVLPSRGPLITVGERGRLLTPPGERGGLLTPPAPAERGELLTPRRLRSLGRWTWASGDPVHPVPIALLAPPPPAGLQGPPAMRALAEGLGLRPAGERIPAVDTRARAVPGGFDIQFERPGCILPVPAAAEVVTLAVRTGTLLLTVGLDLLPPDTPWEDLSDYVRDGVAADRVWFGSVTVTR